MSATGPDNNMSDIQSTTLSSPLTTRGSSEALSVTLAQGAITKRRAHVGRTFDTKNSHKKRPIIHRNER